MDRIPEQADDGALSNSPEQTLSGMETSVGGHDGAQPLADSGQSVPRLIEGKRNTEEYDISFSRFIQCLQSFMEGGEEGKSLYIFRGQSRSEQCLQPSALRKDRCKELRLLDSAVMNWQTELKERYENGKGPTSLFDKNPMNRAMRLFCILASRQGLDLPSRIADRDLVIDPLRFITPMDDTDWTTDGAYLELAAIAQHYGFPTLLLDWTLDPLCALYFAVRGSLEHLAAGDEKYDLSNGSFSVFALKYNRFNWEEPQILFRIYNHHSNKNLIAQKGLFTYVLRKDLKDQRTILDLTDELYSGMIDLDSGRFVMDNNPALVKFNVRYSDVIDAMDHLKQRFKTSDTFFPGYEGIVMAMKDHINYQIVKKRIDDEL